MKQDSPPSPLRILIADDHAVVREGLETIIMTQPDMELVGTATNGLEAVSLARETNPDVILMDLVMPQLDGLAAIQEIMAENPDAKILVLTSFADDERVFPAIQAGAMGYLLKDTLPNTLLQSIREVARGQISLHSTIARRMIREIKQPSQKPDTPDILTTRELETLRLVARGLGNQESAEILHIHQKTVAKYISNILSKLHLANRTQIALYALRHGLADLGPN